MQRTLNTAERNIQTLPPEVITIAAGGVAVLLADSRSRPGEIGYRRIQNVGAGNLYVSIGVTDANGNASCNDTNNFHKMLVPGQEMDCSNDRQIVCGYSADGTIVATELRQRL